MNTQNRDIQATSQAKPKFSTVPLKAVRQQIVHQVAVSAETRVSHQPWRSGWKKAWRWLSGPPRLYFPVPTDVGQQRWRREPAITGKVRARPPGGSRQALREQSEAGSWGRQQREETDLRNGHTARWGCPKGAPAWELEEGAGAEWTGSGKGLGRVEGAGMERKRRLGLRVDLSEGWWDSAEGVLGTNSCEETECWARSSRARKTSSQSLGVEATVRKLGVREELVSPGLGGAPRHWPWNVSSWTPIGNLRTRLGWQNTENNYRLFWSPRSVLLKWSRILIHTFAILPPRDHSGCC